MTTESTIPATCFNDACPRHDDSESGCDCRGVWVVNLCSGYKKQPTEVDDYHKHEIIDRCHIVNSMIDDFLVAHHATDEQMKKLFEEAQSKISEVMMIII